MASRRQMISGLRRTSRDTEQVEGDYSDPITTGETVTLGAGGKDTTGESADSSTTTSKSTSTSSTSSK